MKTHEMADDMWRKRFACAFITGLHGGLSEGSSLAQWADMAKTRRKLAKEAFAFADAMLEESRE